MLTFLGSDDFHVFDDIRGRAAAERGVSARGVARDDERHMPGIIGGDGSAGTAVLDGQAGDAALFGDSQKLFLLHGSEILPRDTVYEDYAVRYGIIVRGQYDLTENATRAQFAEIISAALPEEALKAINDVKTLPDMDAGDPRLPAVLQLYNAGILTGTDDKGTFRPDALILREQAAAMMTRVSDPELRQTFVLAPDLP